MHPGDGLAPVRAAHARVMVDAAFEFIGLLARDGTLLEVNRAALALIGGERADLLGRPFWETPWWASDAAEREKLRRAVAAAAAGEFVRYETRHRDREARAVDVDFSLTPVRDEEGAVWAIVAEGRDVTERRRAEAALQVSEQRLAGIIALAPEAIISVDAAQRIVLFNQGAERIFGWTAAEVLGQPLDLLVPPRLQAAHRAHVDGLRGREAVVRRMADRHEISGLRRDGTVFPAEASFSKFVVEGVPVLTAVLRDISERRAMEARDRELLARESAAREAAEAAERRARFLAELGTALDSSLDCDSILASLASLLVPRLAPCCVIDVTARAAGTSRAVVAHADPARRADAARLAAFAWDPARPYHARSALLGTPELCAPLTDDALASRAQSGAHLAALRALAPASLVSVPLSAHGAVLGSITLLAADTDRPLGAGDLQFAEEVAARAAIALDNARLYREALRAAELRDRTLGVVSHDLRGPLSAIGLAVRGLEPLIASSAEARDVVHTILDASHLMQRLIQDLLDVASIEAGGFRIERRPTDLLLLLVRAANMFDDAAAQRGIELCVELPDDLPAVLADGDRFLQVVTNLLDNALKFTSPGRRVVLRGEAEGDRCRITVRDEGAGIPPDELPHIFDRFWHARRGAPRRGTGLGLAIAKEIVERHEGELHVESTVGVGTLFSVTIPAIDPAASDAGRPRAPAGDRPVAAARRSP